MTTPDASSTPTRRRWPVVLAVALVMLVGAELAARAVMTQLPEPLVWPRYEVQRKVERMDVLGRSGCVDVAIFGSSVANAAIDAGQLSELSGQRVYNAGLGGSAPDAWPTWAAEVVIPAICPREALIGVTLRDLNDIDVDASFLDSYRRSIGRLDRVGELGGWAQAKKTAWDNSGLFALQRSFRRPADALAFASSGAGPWRVINDQYGTLTRFRNAGYDNSAARRNYDRNVVFAEYSPSAARIEALIELASTLDRNGASVSLVLLPFTDETVDYLDDGTDDVAAFVAAMTELASREQLPLIDLLDVIDDRSVFADDYHPNGEGASLVTSALHERR